MSQLHKHYCLRFGKHHSTIKKLNWEKPTNRTTSITGINFCPANPSFLKNIDRGKAHGHPQSADVLPFHRSQ